MTKRIKLADSTMQVVILGNFDIIPKSINPAFHQTGWWYEHFTRDSLDVTTVNDPIMLQPGEFRLYTTKQLAKSAIGIEEGEVTDQFGSAIAVYPTAFRNEVTFAVRPTENVQGLISVYDLGGRQIWQHTFKAEKGQDLLVNWDANLQNLTNGMYLYRVVLGDQIEQGKLVKQ
jgi:hypothetical protein